MKKVYPDKIVTMATIKGWAMIIISYNYYEFDEYDDYNAYDKYEDH